jgi:hypothetical protein
MSTRPASASPRPASRSRRPAGPMAHGGSVIAFIEDPDGYRIELVQRS